jgi:Putative peptidoglycan binding domain
MALKDTDAGVKILGGLAAFALLMALLSDADPDHDAWGGGDAVAATAASDGGTDSPTPSDDPWSAGPAESGLPACDGTAPFAAAGGRVRLPVDGPIALFGSPDCRLDRWTGSDDAVRLLQDALARCNGQAVTVDGAYGPQTRQAVSAVQEEHGARVDGVYGPDTRRAMAWPQDTGDGGVSCDSSAAAG